MNLRVQLKHSDSIPMSEVTRAAWTLWRKEKLGEVLESMDGIPSLKLTFLT